MPERLFFGDPASQAGDGLVMARPGSQAGSSAGLAPAVFSEEADLSGAAVLGWESGFSTAAHAAL